MFFGASLTCGFSSIQSFSENFKIQKDLVYDIVFQAPSKPLESGVSDGRVRINAEILERIVLENRMSEISDSIKPFMIGKVNSKLVFEGIFMKISTKETNKLTREDIKEVLKDAKLDWLKDKAAKLGIYLSEDMLKSDPARLERWLRKKAQQKGIDFDSDFESIGYQLRKMFDHMKNIGMVNSRGEVIICRGSNIREQVDIAKNKLESFIEEISKIFDLTENQLSQILFDKPDAINKAFFRGTRNKIVKNLKNYMLELTYNIYIKGFQDFAKLSEKYK